jgi:YegS/Rv2252/BmrU family lipid kinase
VALAKRHAVSTGSSVRAVARRFDRRLLRQWTKPRPPTVDRMLVKLTEAADHSVLWLVLAATGAALGGRRGRRAAGMGVGALAFTSATVNGPLKLLVGRRRPTPRRWLRRTPRTSSFPSGHAASAFAFAVAATREVPEAGPVLLPLAAGVAYSRVYLGAHYPSDVLAGAAFGTAVGLATRPVAQRLGLVEAAQPAADSESPVEAVLVVSPHAGHSRGLGRARRELERHQIQITEELSVEHLHHLPELLRSVAGEPRLVIAAGGDGTVGSVAGHLVGKDNVLGVLPLGTGNDFARSLGIPIHPQRAAEVLATGDISSVDLGSLTRESRPVAYFAHAATVGLNVDFSKLATRASVRARLGRLTYLAAALYAVREHGTFECTLHHDGVSDDMRLLQLSVISAPVVGGALGLSVRGPHGEHQLDVLAIEDVPPPRLFLAGVFLLLGVNRRVDGVRVMNLERFEVGSQNPLGLTLDGELDGSLPGRFETVPDGIRVITPRRG